MYARVTRGQTPPERLDEAIRGWAQYQREVTVGQEGFRGNYLLVDRQTGAWQIVGLWDSEANIQATMTPPEQFEAMLKRGDVLAMPTVEVLEVAARNPDPRV